MENENNIGQEEFRNRALRGIGKALDFAERYGSDNQNELMQIFLRQVTKSYNELEDIRMGRKTLGQVGHHPPEDLRRAVFDYRKRAAEIIREIRGQRKG